MIRKEWKIEAPWGRIALASWGEPCNEKVLLCHGRKDNLATFYPLMEVLPGNFYYVAFDLPGHGLSDTFPGALPVSISCLVAAMLQVVEALDWNKFIFIGHSMGTDVGILFNSCYPGKITKNIEIDPLPSISRYAMPQKVFLEQTVGYHYVNYDKIVNQDSGKRYSKENAITALAKSRRLPREIAEPIALRNLTACTDGMYRFNWDVRMNSVVGLVVDCDYYVDVLTQNPLPTLAINAIDRIGQYGYEPGHVKAPEIQSLKKSRSPLFVIVEMTGGHDCHLMNTREVAEKIIWFITTNLDELMSKSKL